MATLSRAVANPSSYFVSPVEVISTGRWSLVAGAAAAHAIAKSKLTNMITGFRMADAEGTEGQPLCKAKTGGVAGDRPMKEGNLVRCLRINPNRSFAGSSTNR